MAQEAYDYVIVGGGSAGCVLAARLSENPDVTVCLVEAGGRDRHPLYHIPAGFSKMTKGIGSWGWSTVPQRHLGGRVLPFTQAKVIGGGSTINAQIYTRGHRLDFDEWRQMGCEGWGYDDVLPYFTKAERNDIHAAPAHGVDGTLAVSQPAAPLPICEAFFAAGQQLGIPRSDDLANSDPVGLGYYQLTQAGARRYSAARAFLRPALKRRNLTVKYGTQGLRLITENHRATAVEIADLRGRSRIFAEREIVLTSGAIGTPWLLMRSGIGPSDHLREIGIDVVFDQPQIGANLQDHLDLFTISECSGDHTYDKYAKPHWAALAGLRYLFTRSGPAASSLFETGGFWHADEAARSPDIQFHLGLGSGIEAGVAQMKNPGVTLNSAYLRPQSRGTVRLTSADPMEAPSIDPNYWEIPHDRVMAIRGLRLAQDIMRQAPLTKFIKREVLPGADIRTDDDYFRYACQHAKTDHHPVGTCRMGVDKGAVVDPQLRFRGIERLRIADASIMPRIISSNTKATTMMIAEKAADLISRKTTASK